MRVIIFLLLLLSTSVYGQNLNKKYIDNWLIKCDTNIKLKNINLYVLNGEPCKPNDSLKINNTLNSLKEALLGIDYISSGEFPNSELIGKYVVIISSKLRTKAKQKRELLNEARLRYLKSEFYQNHIDTDSKEPVLEINGKLIFHSECYAMLKKIKLQNIYAIFICAHAVPQQYYGQNAKNGLIKIWTNKL